MASARKSNGKRCVRGITIFHPKCTEPWSCFVMFHFSKHTLHSSGKIWHAALKKGNCLRKNFILRSNVHLQCALQQVEEKHGGASTVNSEEVAKFSQMAGQWWDELGEVRPLHAMNELRVPLIRDGLAPASALDSARPLAGLRVLDVGCGGGLLAEPLARLGALVTGIDAAELNVQVAEMHAACDRRLRAPGLHRPHYRCCTVEQLAEDAQHSFDAVVASEVLEHVDNQQLFVDTCCQLLKPGGSLFVTTLNRSQLAWLAGVVFAEHVLRLLPVGTHDWNKFIRPDELHALLAANGLTLRLQHGLYYNPVTCRWSWCADTSVNYAVHAVAPLP